MFFFQFLSPTVVVLTSCSNELTQNIRFSAFFFVFTSSSSSVYTRHILMSMTSGNCLQIYKCLLLYYWSLYLTIEPSERQAVILKCYPNRIPLKKIIPFNYNTKKKIVRTIVQTNILSLHAHKIAVFDTMVIEKSARLYRHSTRWTFQIVNNKIEKFRILQAAF